MSELDAYLEWKGWTADTFGVLGSYDRRYFHMEMRRAGLRSLSGLRVLEIGFGNGVFAAWARSSGALYSGVEVDEALVQRGLDAGFDVSSSLPAADGPLRGRLDAVVAFDVFEHLDRDAMRRMLADLRLLLKPGGVLVGRVPSGDSPFSRHYQHGDLTHLQVIGTGSVRQVAGLTGFTVEGIRPQAYPVRGLGLRLSLRRLVVHAARSLAYPLVAGLLMGARNAVMSPNLVFVLRNP